MTQYGPQGPSAGNSISSKVSQFQQYFVSRVNRPQKKVKMMRHQVVKIEKFFNNPKNLIKNLFMQFPNVDMSIQLFSVIFCVRFVPLMLECQGSKPVACIFFFIIFDYFSFSRKKSVSAVRPDPNSLFFLVRIVFCVE